MRRLLGTPAEAPQGPTNSRNSGGGADTNLDTNMVIILAALLCTLICALGLNSIARCALRCGRRADFESTEEEGAEAARHAAGVGLKRRALRRIPVAVYGAAAEGVAVVPDAATECPICLGEFAHGEMVRVLPKCNHGFHVGCIDTWLMSHSMCPMCRRSLLEKEPASRAVHMAVDQVT